MNRFVCIHGHFYQPPRENPWLEEIELQDSAYPYRDWNERITFECYAPNAASRVLDEKGYITQIINNYAQISFNFGPTLFSWLERYQPEVYRTILEADRLSRERFSGHGSAIAQAYNHMIMPLANARDKRTQVEWGIKDFVWRFGRPPDGMWLPETAVDLPTLEVLAECGIPFTILAPGQAKRVRKLGEKEWSEVSGGRIDPQKPYLCRLPSGKTIVLFFYDGPIAQDVAFNHLLQNGEGFAHRLVGTLAKHPSEPRLSHIATDGETYGHHHRFGNMALTYCFHVLEHNKLALLTIYGEFLAKNPPVFEVEIIENSSWSCMNGVERWRSGRGSNTGMHPTWQQNWREPLRNTLDWLRDQLIPLYESQMNDFTSEPWQARNDYIEVMLDRRAENVENFFRTNLREHLSDEDKVKILKLLEMQRHAMYMFTSCGWFFDEISGIETVQILQYAARAMQLAREVGGPDLEGEFIRRLEPAESNLAEWKNGAEIYRKSVKPEVVDALSMGAHFAISSLFENYGEVTPIYSYTITRRETHAHESGKQRFVFGCIHIRSEITREETLVDYSVLYLGDYNLTCGVRHHVGDEESRLLHEQLREEFQHNNITHLIRVMNDRFGQHNYTLRDLFKNEQGRVLNEVFNNTLESIDTHFREIYDHYYPLMQIKPEFRLPLPKALAMTVEFILNRDLIEVLENADPDVDRLEKLAREIRKWNFTRDKETLSYVAGRSIDRLMDKFSKTPRDIKLLKKLCSILRLLAELSLPLDLWKTQNIYFSLSKTLYQDMRRSPDSGEFNAQEWLALFGILGEFLKVKIS